MGLTAFGVPVLLSLVVPNLQRFSDMLEVGGPRTNGAAQQAAFHLAAWLMASCCCVQEAPLTLATLQVRSALVVAVGRCMRWNGGREAARIRQLVRGTCLQDAAVAVDPLAVENKLTPKSRRSRPASRLPWHCLL